MPDCFLVDAGDVLKCCHVRAQVLVLEFLSVSTGKFWENQSSSTIGRMMKGCMVEVCGNCGA
jgi:hypothetical protein